MQSATFSSCYIVTQNLEATQIAVAFSPVYLHNNRTKHIGRSGGDIRATCATSTETFHQKEYLRTTSQWINGSKRKESMANVVLWII
jgi:hypothetical protein